MARSFGFGGLRCTASPAAFLRATANEKHIAMAVIDIVLPRNGTRLWHRRLAEALAAAGHHTQVVLGERENLPPVLHTIIRLEQKLFLKGKKTLAACVPILEPTARHTPDMTLALAEGGRTGLPTLRFMPNAAKSAIAEWATVVAAGALPDLTLYGNDVPISRAKPMIDNRAIFIRALDDVLARAVTLAVDGVRKALAGADVAVVQPAPSEHSSSLLGNYLSSHLSRLVQEAWRRRRYHQAHWRVAYRFNDGPGVAETGTLAGLPWTVLPDDSQRFYADPFPFEWEGQHYIFVEDYVHAVGKAVISVSVVDAPGVALRPVPVLEEAHHLSYPQVLCRDGEVWMLPEASAGREVVLYRCTRFPDRWERHAVLIDGKSLSDATLLEHDGCLWLFATDNSLGGSSSDTLVVYRADALAGPWEPHPQNPITIDRSAARPGGAMIRNGDKLTLPLQDGTLGYGGGLGLAEIVKLTRQEVVLGAPRPIETNGFWPYPQIHTLNRHGPLEVIDGIAAVRRRRKNTPLPSSK